MAYRCTVHALAWVCRDLFIVVFLAMIVWFLHDFATILDENHCFLVVFASVPLSPRVYSLLVGSRCRRMASSVIANLAPHSPLR